ncbi:MAG TPA: Hsp20/alpha crystallin family protein [Actinoplanes sp.]
MTITHARRYRQDSTPARRGDPVAEIEQLQDQMGQIINSFMRDPLGVLGTQQPAVWVPPADIEETDDSYVLELDLPGVNRDDINIELRDNEVRITGEVKEKERSGVLRRRTRRVGQFEFLLTLPGDIDPEKVEASLHDGVLTVRLGKAAASRPRQIDVKET